MVTQPPRSQSWRMWEFPNPSLYEITVIITPRYVWNLSSSPSPLMLPSFWLLFPPLGLQLLLLLEHFFFISAPLAEFFLKHRLVCNNSRLRPFHESWVQIPLLGNLRRCVSLICLPSAQGSMMRGHEKMRVSEPPRQVGLVRRGTAERLWRRLWRATQPGLLPRSSQLWNGETVSASQISVRIKWANAQNILKKCLAHGKHYVRISYDYPY